jgi:hypothetical protein
MATGVEPAATAAATNYQLEGTILEVCDCNVLCPCWIGEDPDGGTCDAAVAYHIERGVIGGVDVSGLNWVGVGHIPGNVLAGGWRQTLFVDESATPEQFKALEDAFRGRLGGPLADLAQLVGEVVAIQQVPIEYTLEEGEGVLRIGTTVSAQVSPYRGPSGATTTLNESIFSTIPGSPAWVAKAEHFRVDLPEHGFEWAFEGRNAIQGEFRFAH